MSHLRVVAYEVDDEHSEEGRELSRFVLPGLDPKAVSLETTFDELEESIGEMGSAILQAVFEHRWKALDKALAEANRRHFSP